VLVTQPINQTNISGMDNYSNISQYMTPIISLILTMTQTILIIMSQISIYT
jgi:hypothetical protein